MSLEALHPWIAVGVTLLVFLGLQLRRGASADLVFLTGLLIVSLTGVISVGDALAGFANPAVLAIGGLFAITAGLRTTGVLDWVGQKLLGTANTEKAAMWRIAAAMIASSAFVASAL